MDQLDQSIGLVITTTAQTTLADFCLRNVCRYLPTYLPISSTKVWITNLVLPWGYFCSLIFVFIFVSLQRNNFFLKEREKIIFDILLQPNTTGGIALVWSTMNWLHSCSYKCMPTTFQCSRYLVSSIHRYKHIQELNNFNGREEAVNAVKQNFKPKYWRKLNDKAVFETPILP